MAIYVVTGKPRHGKTYYIASLIPRWIKNGERIFSNFKINVGQGKLKKYDKSIVGDLYNEQDLANDDKQIFYWRNLFEWNKMKQGIILVDEAQRYLNARQWAQLSEDTEIKLQEHGKEDLDVWCSTQHFSRGLAPILKWMGARPQPRIDISLRILAELYFEVKMVFGNPDNRKSLLPKICRIDGYTLEDIQKKDSLGKEKINGLEPESSERFAIKKSITSIYNTREKVGRSLPMPLVHKVRTCPSCGIVKVEHV